MRLVERLGDPRVGAGPVAPAAARKSLRRETPSSPPASAVTSRRLQTARPATRRALHGAGGAPVDGRWGPARSVVASVFPSHGQRPLQYRKDSRRGQRDLPRGRTRQLAFAWRSSGASPGRAHPAPSALHMHVNSHAGQGRLLARGVPEPSDYGWLPAAQPHIRAIEGVLSSKGSASAHATGRRACPRLANIAPISANPWPAPAARRLARLQQQRYDRRSCQDWHVTRAARRSLVSASAGLGQARCRGTPHPSTGFFANARRSRHRFLAVASLFLAPIRAGRKARPKGDDDPRLDLGWGLHERAAFVDTAPRFAGCVNDEFVFAIAVSAEIGLRMPARNSRLDAAPAVGSTPSGTLAADDAIIVGKEKRLVRSMQARQRVTDVRIPRSTNANRA